MMISKGMDYEVLFSYFTIVWYGDYTTIDWIHDITKDRFRVRKMRNRKVY
jgi:hypothetical protein